MKTYLLGIAAAAVAVSVLSGLLRKGAIRQTVMLAGGLWMLLHVLAPLSGGLADFAQYLSGLELRQDAVTSGIEVENRQIMGTIITEKTEAYILDKAASLGAAVEAEVGIRQGSHYPYPWDCVIRGALTEAQKDALRRDLELSLGIPEERQVYLP